MTNEPSEQLSPHGVNGSLRSSSIVVILSYTNSRLNCFMFALKPIATQEHNNNEQILKYTV
jgi:hypothetical protein